MKFKKYLALLVILLPALASAQLNILIENAYVRESPPGAETVAAYMVIINTGQHPLSLSGVSSDAAETAMIHLSSMQDGMMVMEHFQSLDLPPRESVVFEPGGYHIMLSGLRRPLREGDSIRLILNFSSGLVLSATVPVIRSIN